MKTVISILPVLMLCAACTELGQFSTDAEHVYRGSVITGKFIRSGFHSDVELEMTFHVDQVEMQPDQYGMGGPGILRTTDGLFDNSALEPIPEFSHDQLSNLDFPNGRLRSYMFFCRPGGSAQDMALVIVSLMEDEKVEVRIMRGGDEPLYGVFRLGRESIDRD